MEKKKYYPDADQNLNFAKMEEGILDFWNKNKIFEESIDIRKNGEEFVFYDGPPFANGLPHYGHMLAGYIKDTFARYQTMKGKKVERVFGWDCHGLPAEMGVEKETGISGRKAIEEYGIDKFNDLCKSSVMKYVNEWKHYVNRTGRWVDFDNGYKTMDLKYMESVIWVFKQLYDKGLLYEDFRVMPYSWTCQTPVSNAETKQDNSYREKADKAITVKFKMTDDAVEEFKKRLTDNSTSTDLQDGEKQDNAEKNNSIFNFQFSSSQSSAGTSPNDKLPVASELSSVELCASIFNFLAWTTTPWTLPSNLALAVNKDYDYVILEKDGEYYIIGKETLPKYKKELADAEGKFNIIAEFKGEKLLGLHYEPILPYIKDLPEVQASDAAFSVLHGDYVTTTDGTGIVHTAPGFGEDDNMVCKKYGIPTVCPVDDGGCFIAPIDEFVGKQVFETNDLIIIKLKQEGKWLKTEQYIHNYPHCWRTDAPLIYRALPSWYVNVEKIKDKLIKNNQKINWIPAHVKDGRFGKWLEGARDWSISRNRFFGCPIPVWKSDNPDYPRIEVYGSIKELEEAFGVEVKDLHRPFIDNLTRPNPDDPTGKSKMVRVKDVMDCWFESGSMPYAQHHYPFENKEWFESHFPADFITEGDGQLRGWFYVLLILSTALFDEPAFKNCISYGIAVDETGKKLSKRLRNYVDPLEVCNLYGSDALRWFMIKSPALKGEELRIDKDAKDIKETLRMSIKPIINAYNFFCMYANSDGVKGEDITTKDVYYAKSGIADKKLIDDALTIRKEVFIKGQNIKEEDEIDGHDFDLNKLHYVLYKDEKPIATIRVWINENTAILQRFSVLPEYRGKGLGRELLTLVIKNLLNNSKITKIEFHAQSYLKDFYQRMGFTCVGDEFDECGIKHISMFANTEKLHNIDYKSNAYIISNTMDIYILSKLKKTIDTIRDSMDNYTPSLACKETEDFFEVLNNWYIRRNKNRFWKSEHDDDKLKGYDTLYTVLLKISEALAPLLPFTTEYVWRGLTQNN